MMVYEARDWGAAYVQGQFGIAAFFFRTGAHGPCPLILMCADRRIAGLASGDSLCPRQRLRLRQHEDEGQAAVPDESDHGRVDLP